MVFCLGSSPFLTGSLGEIGTSFRIYSKRKKIVEMPILPSTNVDGSQTLTMDPNLCGHEHFFIFARKDAPEEEVEKEVCEKVFNSFKEGDIVHILKRRTIVATHYTVVRDRQL